nr:MAG TPA_asm: hypothetical protein [Bacteriophage sp.]
MSGSPGAESRKAHVNGRPIRANQSYQSPSETMS